MEYEKLPRMNGLVRAILDTHGINKEMLVGEMALENCDLGYELYPAAELLEAIRAEDGNDGE
jgi:hypothetical protein